MSTVTVLVFGTDGEPLSPCHPARARQLVKRRRAEVIATDPYSIRLLPACPAPSGRDEPEPADQTTTTGDGHAN